MRIKIVKSVKDVYNHFFEDLNIDSETGHFKIGRKQESRQTPNKNYKKFATYPYIGSKYGEPNHPKLLIVGLDIGGDKTPGRIQSFRERRHRYETEVVNDPDKHSHHSAGTYMTALYCLQQKSPEKYPEWAEYWKQLDDQKTCQQLLKENELPLENPLSYIALTNYHKFEPCGREKKRGEKDRDFIIDEELEGEFLVAEVEAFAPDIIVIQSERFSKPPYKKEPLDKIASEPKRELYVGPHPSWVPVHKPRALINSIKQYHPYCK